MKILAEESVVRYHVEFDEGETSLLKDIGFLPLYAEPCARLWSTAAEIDETKAMIAKAREFVNREPKCAKCNDTGIYETGNNDLPCDCPAGETALFNHAGVVGPVTGAEIKRHFLNDSPDPLRTGHKSLRAEDLPGRRDASTKGGEP